MQIRRLCRQLPKGLLHADYWCHLGVTSKHSEERSSCFRGTRISLLTKHRFSIKYDQSWCHLQLDIRKAGLFVTMQPVQVSPHSAGPVLSAMRKKLPKKNDCGEEVWNWEHGENGLCCFFFFFGRKRVVMKGAKRPNKSLTRLKLSSA